MSVKHNEPIVVEIIKNRLYWTNRQHTAHENSVCYSSDGEFKYYPFFNDYGPYDINQTYKFCHRLNSMLQDADAKSQKLFHCTSNNPHKKANSAYLMGAYCIIVLKKTAFEVSHMFEQVNAGFRDALDGECDYICTINDCFEGLEQAIRRGWFKFSTFSSADYEFYCKNENGDLNWIVPSQFLAFKSPSNTTSFIKSQCLSVEKYCPILKKLGITTIIRLNRPCYPSEVMEEQGLHHYDLYFKDGSVPSIDIVNNFIEVCTSERGAIGVHCKAGLGRTGTLIGCYAIKIFKFPARAFIAWCRLCRPGSILGPQQQFLIDYEISIKKKTTFSLNTSHIHGHKAIFGDHNQAEKLIDAKAKRESLNDTLPEFPHHYRHESLDAIDLSETRLESQETPKITHKCQNKSREQTPVKSKYSGFNSEIQKLCMRKGIRPGASTAFYALAAKNLKTVRVMKILYGTSSCNE